MRGELKSRDQPVHIKMVDSAGAEQVFMEEDPAGNKQTADFSLDHERGRGVEGRIQTEVCFAGGFFGSEGPFS